MVNIQTNPGESVRQDSNDEAAEEALFVDLELERYEDDTTL